MPLPSSNIAIERVSAKQKVYETIKDWIISRQLLPGEKVSDMEMAERFNVSRTPVREALQLLEAQKLIKSYPGKATLVTEIETENIEKWYSPAMMLHELGVSMAMDKITPEHITQLRGLSKNFANAIADQSDPMPILKADYDFHKYILEVAENEYIVDFCDVLWIHIQRLEYSFFRKTPMETSVEEHEKMIEALEQRDNVSASEIMKKHWERTATTLRQLIGEGEF